jgi:malate synthase
MEDAATAEISRSQVWQWIHHGASLNTGQRVTRELVQQLEEEELARIRQGLSPQAAASNRFDEARELFDAVALSEQFVEFLTLPAYGHLD